MGPKLRSVDWDGLGFYGLAAREVSRAFYAATGDSGLPAGQKVSRYKDKPVRGLKPRKVEDLSKPNRSIVVNHRELKGKVINTGVVFAGDAYERPEENRPGTKDETLTRTEPGMWVGHRVDMNGCEHRRMHSSGGKNAKRSTKKKIEVLRKR